VEDEEKVEEEVAVEVAVEVEVEVEVVVVGGDLGCFLQPPHNDGHHTPKQTSLNSILKDRSNPRGSKHFLFRKKNHRIHLFGRIHTSSPGLHS